ncbi:MAG: cytidylate kinase-like family protein [Clostridia bacterium]|nr:cytidylate kinase-like family protein [Clostridia bacterium]
MNIVTISREFGSGGREIGKKVADILGYDYYDREIIAEIAKRHNVDEKYVDYALNNHAWQTYSLSFHHSFVSPIYVQSPDAKLLHEQRKIIEEIAATGKNCVIVGRNADVLLKDKNPLDIFICADMESKIKRCQERADKDEQLSYKEIKRMIKRIDKNRARTRYIIADGEWGHRKSYDLIVNTTDWDLDRLSTSLAEFVKCYFNNKETE